MPGYSLQMLINNIILNRYLNNHRGFLSWGKTHQVFLSGCQSSLQQCSWGLGGEGSTSKPFSQH